MNLDPDYRLDIDGIEVDSASDSGSMQDRPWVGILFDCCGVYVRIYRNKEGTAYAGRCPRCMTPVRLRVGPGGTDSRFFVAE